MKYAMKLQLRLLELGFHFDDAEDISGGERFRLGEGVAISVYDNGTVLVQGKFKPQYRAWAYQTLRRILPKTTIWKDK